PLPDLLPYYSIAELKELSIESQLAKDLPLADLAGAFAAADLRDVRAWKELKKTVPPDRLWSLVVPAPLRSKISIEDVQRSENVLDLPGLADAESSIPGLQAFTVAELRRYHDWEEIKRAIPKERLWRMVVPEALRTEVSADDLQDAQTIL